MLFAPGTNYKYTNTNTVPAHPRARAPDPHQSPTGAAFPSPHAQGYTDWTGDCYLTRACGTTINATNWNSSVAWAAGGMISTLGDLHRWARDLATGRLLTPATQRQRLRFLPEPGVRRSGMGLGLEYNNGWIGHQGDWAGYQTLIVYLPSQQATLVLLINTNMSGAPLLALAKSITSLITPKHVYEVVATTD